LKLSAGIGPSCFIQHSSQVISNNVVPSFHEQYRNAHHEHQFVTVSLCAHCLDRRQRFRNLFKRQSFDDFLVLSQDYRISLILSAMCYRQNFKCIVGSVLVQYSNHLGDSGMKGRMAMRRAAGRSCCSEGSLQARVLTREDILGTISHSSRDQAAYKPKVKVDS
jgi:hypothetical protein